MSLVGTLAKVAAGVMVAKGVSGMMGGRSSAGAQAPGGAGQASAGGDLGDLLGQMMGGGASGGASGGGLQDMLGQMMGGGGATAGGAGGGLQDMLGQILGAGAGAAAGAGAGASRGGLGGALDELSQMSRPGEASGGAAQGGFGDLLNQSFEQFNEPTQEPSDDQEELAGVMVRAMIQAVKADGRIDEAEQQRLIEKLGITSQSDMDFVNAEIKRPVDLDGLVRSVPRGAEQQAYLMSALAIDLDHNSEARYLQQLASGLKLDAATVNAIHQRMGIPQIFA